MRLLIVVAVGVLTTFSAAVDPLRLYVSPSGSNTHTGASPEQALLSCAGAVSQIKQLSSWPVGGVEVQFSEGVYPLTATSQCGTISTLATAQSPLVLRGAASGAGTVFDGTQRLQTADLRKVSDPSIKVLLNPAARSSILEMPIPNGTWSGGQLYWNSIPMTPSIWPNNGLGYVQRVNDVGAIWCEGRTKGPRPHCSICRGDNISTPAEPCGANVTLAEQPAGDWRLELASGPGFGDIQLSGYLAYDWYRETHRIVRVLRQANETSVQFSDSSRYGMIESLENKAFAPGRYTVTGLLSEVDSPGEWWFNSVSRKLYLYPLPSGARLDAVIEDKLREQLFIDKDHINGLDVELSEQQLGLETVHLGVAAGPGLVTLHNCSWVTIRDVTVTGFTGTAVTISGGQSNTVGGSTFKNGGGGVLIEGGHGNRVVGNDIYDVGSHISATGNAGDGVHNLVPTNNLIENNQLTQVFNRGAWQMRLAQGDRFSHNLLHDASGQLLLPGGPLTMVDHNEVFNTGYVEGDGGVMYSGASLTNGYGMQYRENFVHHSLEVPGLHGRGGIYFDDHEGSISNCSGNVMYKAAGRSFLVNGGAANNITHNLIINGGIGIYNQHADDMTHDLPLYDNGTLKRGDKTDYIWKVEQALGVTDFNDIFDTPLANRWPTFKRLLSVNSTTKGWASAALSNFQHNVFLNMSSNICLLTSYHPPNNTHCDGALDRAQQSGELPKLIETNGAINAQFSWFPEAENLEFVNATLGFDTRSMGLRCDGWRRSIPVARLYRPWVRNTFSGVPSAAVGEYTPEAAGVRSSMHSGLVLVHNFTQPCPVPTTKVNCHAIWVAWGECEADGFQVMRYTIEDYSTVGGLECEHPDGFAKRQQC